MVTTLKGASAYDLHIGPSYPKQLSASTFLGDPTLAILDDNHRNPSEPSPELAGQLLLPETDDQPQNSKDLAANGDVLSISNWHLLWGLHLTNGSLKCTKCQYRSMRVIADTFRRVAEEADDKDVIEKRLVEAAIYPTVLHCSGFIKRPSTVHWKFADFSLWRRSIFASLERKAKYDPIMSTNFLLSISSCPVNTQGQTPRAKVSAT